MKLLRNLLAVLTLLLISTSPAWAVNLTVTCDTVNKCQTSPSTGAALFEEPDIKPGYNIPREITVINDDIDEDCYLYLRTKNEDDPNNLAPVLNTVIRDTAVNYFGTGMGSWSASNDKNLSDLFSYGTISLGVVPMGTTKIFLWAVTMDPGAGNQYQGITAIFDFDLFLECGSAPTPTPTPNPGRTSRMGKDGPSCENPNIYVTYDVEDNGNPVEDVEVTFTYLGGNEHKVKTNSDGRASTTYGYGGAGEIRAEASGYPTQSVYIDQLICPSPTPTPTPPAIGGGVAGAATELLPFPTPTPEIEGAGAIEGVKTCCPKVEPWWWILLIAQTGFLSRYFMKKIKDQKVGDWELLTVGIVILSLVLHAILHSIFVNKLGYEESPWCKWFWLMAIFDGLVLALVYRFVIKKEK
jgi:hypothetical protein